MTTSGRAAILLALEERGICAGDEVLLPTYHCPTMVEPVARVGATPIFYPVTATGGADLCFLKRLDTRRAKALLAAHFFGLPQDLQPVRHFCDERGLLLIEDCAHAFFGRSAFAAVGSVGDVAIASLPKFFPVVEGGCLVERCSVPNPPGSLRAPGLVRQFSVVWDALELAADLGRLGALTWPTRAFVSIKRTLRSHPATRAPSSKAVREESPFKTIDDHRAHTRAAGFVRWAVLNTDAEFSAQTRRRNYMRFARNFDGVAGMRPVAAALPDGAVPYVFPLSVDIPEPLYAALRTRGVPLYRWDIVWPGTPCLEGDYGTQWSTKVFQLCCHQSMTEDDVDAVSAAVVLLARQLAE